jgi:hypothetical protein
MPKRIFTIEQRKIIVELFKAGCTNFSELSRYCDEKWGIKTHSYTINKLITKESKRDKELKVLLESKKNPNLLELSRVQIQKKKYYERDKNKES